jgi:carboxymethylenebutenolidase
MSEHVEVETADGPMPAHLWLPEAGSGPGLLLLQEIFGVSRYIRGRAQDLADLGYVVLAPEIYWRVGRTEPIEGEGALEEAFGVMQQVAWDTAVADGVAGFHALRQRSEVSGGAGVIGFCYGGGLGYQVAGATDADVLVSYYGSALADLVDVLPPVTAPSLHHFGLADQYLDRATVARLETKLGEQPETTVLTYEGADHAFDNPDFVGHHPEASAEAWTRTCAWLGEHLPVR